MKDYAGLIEVLHDLVRESNGMEAADFSDLDSEGSENVACLVLRFNLATLKAAAALRELSEPIAVTEAMCEEALNAWDPDPDGEWVDFSGDKASLRRMKSALEAALAARSTTNG